MQSTLNSTQPKKRSEHTQLYYTSMWIRPKNMELSKCKRTNRPISDPKQELKKQTNEWKKETNDRPNESSVGTGNEKHLKYM